MDPAKALEASEIARNGYINETIARGDSDIQQFYNGAVVLVTGGSGFIGKQLIEKLFRACNPSKVYVLLRPTTQKTHKERLDTMLQDAVFGYLHETQAGFVKKIVPIAGDMEQPDLGISEDGWKSITEEVTVIFHGAATVNFTEPLRKATMTNVHGTREMLALAKRCKKLRSFVHISTAYSAATVERAGGPVLEQFYSVPVEPNALIQTVQLTDEAALDAVTPSIISGWPNTYSFTKAVAEEAVRTMVGDLPICIVRPAIVVGAYREPLPGWIDKSTVFGASGFIVGCGLGVLHILYADSRTNLDLVPVDLVNNAVLAAARATVVLRDQGQTDTRIYTVSNMRNPINMGRIVELTTLEGRKFSTPSCIWYGYGVCIKNKFVFNILHFLVHCIPGYFADAILLLLGKRAILTKVYRKLYKFLGVLGYFTTHMWNFDDSNAQLLYRSLSCTDRTIFNFDITCVDWPLYIVLWCVGCRKYIIKDGLNNTEWAVKKQYVFKLLNYVVIPIYLYLIYKTGLVIISPFRYLERFMHLN